MVAEKCKTWKIFRRMCDIKREACFSPKLFTHKLNIDLPQLVRIEKTTRGGNTMTFWYGNVPNAAVSKEGQADSFLAHEKTPHYWLLWKRCNWKQCFPRQNSFYFLNDFIYIYIYIYRKATLGIVFLGLSTKRYFSSLSIPKQKINKKEYCSWLWLDSTSWIALFYFHAFKCSFK